MRESDSEREDDQLRAAVADLHGAEDAPPALREAVGRAADPVARRATRGWHQLSLQEREDVGQEALTRCLPKFFGGPPPSSDKAPNYLKTVVRHGADDLRKRHYRKSEVQIASGEGTGGEDPERADRLHHQAGGLPTNPWGSPAPADPEDRALSAEIAEAIRAAVQALPARYREVMHALCLDGQTLADLVDGAEEAEAAQRGIARSALSPADQRRIYERVRKTKQRAEQRLRQALEAAGLRP